MQYNLKLPFADSMITYADQDLYYVMQWSKMSLKLAKFNFHFSTWLYISFAKLPLTTDPIEIGQLVPKIRTTEGLQKQ